MIKAIYGFLKFLPFCIPLGTAYFLDHDFSNPLHGPVIGIVSCAVALSDALFSQISSITYDIPYSPLFTTSESRQAAKKFEEFYKSIFRSWVTAKIFGTLALLMSACVMVNRSNDFWNRPYPLRAIMLSIGYLFMGISLRCMVFFFVTYGNVRKLRQQYMNKVMINNYDKAQQSTSSDTRESIKSSDNKMKSVTICDIVERK